MQLLDKSIIGARIKSLRKAKGLRQWQMAELLDATQPAVHKYENGILPEVKRLLELARIGNTSIEWILTGKHWENGSEEINRLDTEIYDLAYQIRTLTPEDRKILSDVLDLIKAAVTAVREKSGHEATQVTDAELACHLKGFESHAREALIAALAVYDAVVTTLANSKVSDLHRFGQQADEATESRRPAPAPTVRKNAS